MLRSFRIRTAGTSSGGRRLPGVVIVVLSLIGLPFTLLGQAPQEKPSSLVAGQIDLARLVDLAAERLHIAIEFDPAVIKGSVQLRSGAALSDEELWAFVGDALAARGFTIIRPPGGVVYSVVKLADAAALAGVPSPEATQPHPRPGFRNVVVRTEHRPAKEVAEALSKVASKPSGAVAALGEGGLVLISDLSPRVDQAVALLKLLDVEGPPTRVEEVVVRNLTPQQLATTVAQVVAKRDAVSGEKVPGDVLPSPNGSAVLVVSPESRLSYWRDLVASLDRREGIETATYTPRFFATKDVARLVEQTIKDPVDDRWKLVTDDLTGSLVVAATPGQHELIRALLERLAATPAEARRPVKTFVLKNRPVREIQNVLEQLLSAGAIDAGAVDVPSSPQGGTVQPEAPTVVQQLPLPPAPTGAPGAARPQSASSPPSPAPAPSPPTLPMTAARRASPATATPLSRPGPQAQPERPVIFTSDEGTNTLIAVGEPRLLAQIETLLKTLDVRQPQVMLEVLMVTLSEDQALELGVELEEIQISGAVRIRLASLFGLSTRNSSGNLVPGDPAGFTGAALSPADFSVLVRALQTVNRGRSLSMPKLLVGNNQQASLDSVVQQPYASVNASNTVSTTSFGGSQDAGTTVTIKPQIAEGDHLVLDYSVSLSSFVGRAAAATIPPPRQQNKVQSEATIPDGYTVVVGGIQLETESKSVSQVPLLGSIPVIGEAFKSRSNSSTRSRFYVFIRANILRARGFDDLKYVSAHETAAAGVDDGLPVVEPRVIK